MKGAAGRRRVLAAAALLAVVTLPLAPTGCAPADPSREVDPRAPRLFASHVGWTWFNDERAVFLGPRLLIGFVDTAGYSAVALTKLDDGDEAPQVYRLSSFREVDDHDNPGLLPLEGGRVLAAYAQHNAEPYWYWRVAEVQADSLVWSPEGRSAPVGANATYSNLVRLAAEEGRIYNFFRGQNFDPAYVVSDDQATSWSPPRSLIRSGDDKTRPYVKFASDGVERIDLLFTQAHPLVAETNIYHVFYRNGYLHRTDGTRIQPFPGLNEAPMPAEAGTLVYDAREAGRAWVWDIEYDGAGAPVAVYVAARDSTTGNDLRYRYARWNASPGLWDDREIGFAGTHLYDGENHYAGGITLDPEDTRVVYTSSDVHPETGDSTAHYQIYRGVLGEDGARWTALTPSASEDQIRPFMPRGGPPRVLLWLRGRYTTYRNFDLDVVGLVDRDPRARQH